MARSSPAAASDAGPQLPDASLQDVLLAEDSKGTGSAPATALTLTGLLGTSSDEDVPRLNSRGSRTAAADAPPEKTQVRATCMGFPQSTDEAPVAYIVV